MSTPTLLLASLLFLKGFAAAKIQETFDRVDSLAGLVCPEDERKFVKRAPSVLSCALECRRATRCGGSSFQASTGLCYGCTCLIIRTTNGSLPLEGALFYKQAPENLFQGRCGDVDNVDNGAITAEYFVGGNYSTLVTPTIRLDEPISWVPDRAESYFLKVDFGDIRNIYGFATQGRNNSGTKEYVSEYSVYDSPDCVSKHFVATNKINRELRDHTEKVHKYLDTPFITRCLYLKAENWFSYPSIRFDVLGY